MVPIHSKHSLLALRFFTGFSCGIVLKRVYYTLVSLAVINTCSLQHSATVWLIKIHSAVKSPQSSAKYLMKILEFTSSEMVVLFAASIDLVIFCGANNGQLSQRPNDGN